MVVLPSPTVPQIFVVTTAAPDAPQWLPASAALAVCEAVPHDPPTPACPRAAARALLRQTRLPPPFPDAWPREACALVARALVHGFVPPAPGTTDGHRSRRSLCQLLLQACARPEHPWDEASRRLALDWYHALLRRRLAHVADDLVVRTSLAQLRLLRPLDPPLARALCDRILDATPAALPDALAALVLQDGQEGVLVALADAVDAPGRRPPPLPSSDATGPSLRPLAERRAALRPDLRPALATLAAVWAWFSDADACIAAAGPARAAAPWLAVALLRARAPLTAAWCCVDRALATATVVDGDRGDWLLLPALRGDAASARLRRAVERHLTSPVAPPGHTTTWDLLRRLTTSRPPPTCRGNEEAPHEFGAYRDECVHGPSVWGGEGRREGEHVDALVPPRPQDTLWAHLPQSWLWAPTRTMEPSSADHWVGYRVRPCADRPDSHVLLEVLPPDRATAQGGCLSVSLLPPDHPSAPAHAWAAAHLRLVWPTLAAALADDGPACAVVPRPSAARARAALPFLAVGACHPAHRAPFLAYLFLQGVAHSPETA